MFSLRALLSVPHSKYIYITCFCCGGGFLGGWLTGSRGRFGSRWFCGSRGVGRFRICKAIYII